jgi:hypothetical protein
MFKAHKQPSVFEQKLEHKDAYSKTLDFYAQMEIVKKLQEKFIKEGMPRGEAINKAWRMVREGSHVFQDLDDDDEEVKHEPIKQEIKKHTTINSNINETYRLINKALLIINTICSKHRNDKKYTLLKKYFEKLNGKVK